ncbi:Homeobox-leucine zipper protein PROTODERMAL FACTOR 2, partial [Mucuna pruriens]
MYHSHTNVFDSRQHLLDMSSQRTNSESELGRNREEESGNEITEPPPSGDELDPNQPGKKKRYHRHSQLQIHEMESFFKECPHPDDKQRKELSRELGLEPLQIKFWFQNKRTQVKAQHERHENNLLKVENESLRAENARYKEALSNSQCPSCGGPTSVGEMSFDEQHLRIENVRLREEIDRMSGIASKYGGKPENSYYSMSSQSQMPSRSVDMGGGNYGAQSGTVGEIYGGSNPLRALPVPTDSDKPMIVELAVVAMEELARLALSGEPLWIPGTYSGSEFLNQNEYLRAFPKGIASNPSFGLRTEASRQSAVVIMNHVKLVEILMDVNQWSNVFCGIVSRANTLEVLSTGVAGNYNGALQVMSAEFQVPSPLVPTRDNYFARYCKQHSDESWAVVDFSLDNLRPSSNATSRSRRRPSGCLIQELPNGYSKVIWIEHIEVDDREVHNLYKKYVNSGLAFGATRWVASLDRQCERLASSMATNIPAGDLCVITGPEGRKSTLKLAERMLLSFCTGVGASTAHAWTPLTVGCEDVRVMIRKSMDDPGRPAGIVLNAATSLWLPVPPNIVFDFVRGERSRKQVLCKHFFQWDILSNTGEVREMAHIANGRDPGNCVSLLRVNSQNNSNSSQSNMLILQESCTDATGSYVVYAPVDLISMNAVLSGGNPDYVALLPSGFAVLPDGPGLSNGGPITDVGTGGCLLTVAFQILVDSVPTAKLSLGSVTTVSGLLKCTVERIQNALRPNTPQTI